MQIIPTFSLRSSFIALLLLLGLSACGQTGLSSAEHLTKAKDYLSNQELREAAIELLNAAQKNPDNLEARWLLAKVSLELGDSARAEKEARRVVELGLAPEKAYPLQIQALFLQEDFDKVIVETNQLVEGMPKPDQALVLGLRGQAYLAKQEFEKAKESLSRALEADSSTTAALVGMGKWHGFQGQYEEARRWTQLALDAEASSPDAWSLLGDIEQAERKRKEAEAAYGNAIKFRRYPTLDRAKRALVRIQLEDFSGAQKDIQVLKQKGWGKHPYINYVKGIYHLRQQQYAEAAQAFEASQRALPTYLPTKVYLATTYLIQGKLEQALGLAQQLHSQVPHSLRTKRLLGEILVRRSEFDAAKQVLQTALRERDKDNVTLRMLGTVSLLQGSSRESVEYFEKVVQQEPESQQARDMLMIAKLIDRQPLPGDITPAQDTSPSEVFAPQFLQALDAFNQGQLGQALERAQALHEKYPDKVEPLNLMAAVHLALDEWDQARKELERVLDMAPTEPSASKNLARIELNEGHLSESKTLLERLLAERPDDPEALTLLAQTETRLGNEAQAIQLLEQGIRHNPHESSLRALLAQKYHQAGRVEEVLELTRNLTDQQVKEQPILLKLRGKTQMLRNDVASARRTFERWTQAVPDSAPAHFLYGDSLARSGNLEQAQQELEQAIELDPSYLPARVGEIKMLVQGEEMKKAKKALTQLRADFGDQPPVLGIEGWFALGTGDYSTAEKRFTAALAQNPDTELTLLLVRALWGQEKYDQAHWVMQDWLQDHPRDLPVLLHLADSYLSLNREEQARSLYARVVELYPNHVPALNNLAWLSRNQDLDQAITYAERAYELVPNDPYVLDTLGMLWLKKGEASRGYRMIRKATEQLPEEPEIQLHLARALVQRKQFGKAQEVLSTLVKKVPDSPIADEAKALLESISPQ